MVFRLFLFALIVSTECGYHISGISGYKNGFKGYRKYSKENCCPDDPVYNIIKNLETAEKSLNKLCTDANNAVEVYDNEFYRVKYKLQRNIEDYIKVKINYRIIYVMTNGVSSELKDVRVIPPGLQIKNATWKLDSDTLIVSIPYKHERLVEIQADCEKVRDFDVVDVPLSPDYSLLTEYRYGK